MQLNLKQRLLRAGAVLAAVITLSVPVFAFGALGTWGPPGLEDRATIDPGDDAVVNGMRIVDRENTPRAASTSTVTSRDSASETALREWNYTRDKTGSPGK